MEDRGPEPAEPRAGSGSGPRNPRLRRVRRCRRRGLSSSEPFGADAPAEGPRLGRVRLGGAAKEGALCSSGCRPMLAKPRVTCQRLSSHQITHPKGFAQSFGPHIPSLEVAAPLPMIGPVPAHDLARPTFGQFSTACSMLDSRAPADRSGGPPKTLARTCVRPEQGFSLKLRCSDSVVGARAAG